MTKATKEINKNIDVGSELKGRAKEGRNAKNSSYILGILKRYWYICASYVLLSFVLTQVVVEGSGRIADATDSLFAGELIDLKSLMLVFGVLVLVGTVAAFFKSLSKNTFSINIQTDLRNLIMRKIVGFRYEYFDDEGTGSLMNKLLSDMYQIEGLFAETLPEGVVSLVTIVTVSISIGFMDVKLLLVTIVCYPLLLWLANVFTRKVTKVGVKRRNLYDDLENVALDAYQGITVGKSFNLYEIQKSRVFKVVDDILNNEYDRTRITAIALSFGNIIRWVPRIICYLFVLYEVYKGHLTIGSLLAYVMLLDRITQPLSWLPDYIAFLRESLVSVKRLEEILHQPQEESGSNVYKCESGFPVIEMKDIHFAYGEGEEVLSGFEISVHAGDNVAFVGSSGSGKSTLIKLMCGFYQPKSGEYKIYGHNYREWDIYALRRRIALVSQNVFLFPVSIAENVSYGKEGATKEEIIAACKQANIHDFIMTLPQGYDTLVGERGARLSGGQKQRISIARAFLKDAPVLLLDEPTSAVDVETESLIQEAVARISKGRTVITIAHRLSTIINSDRIYVLEQGKLVESGTHDELLSIGGVYSGLYDMEAKKGGEADGI